MVAASYELFRIDCLDYEEKPMFKSLSLKYFLSLLVFSLLVFSPLQAQFNSAKKFNASLMQPLPAQELTQTPAASYHPLSH